MQLPESFLKRIQETLPDEWEKLVTSFTTESPISIRQNPFKKADSTSLQLDEPISWSSQGVYLKSRPSFTYDPLFHAGAYYVQEASSMFIEQFAKPILDKIEEPVVLDLCAAPGGKSTHLLSLMNGKGVLVSNEIIANRNAILRQNIAKWGCANTLVTQNEASDFQRLENVFDLIVVDAPCSGEGMFRKDKNAITEWSEKNVENCIYRQEEILKDILPALKPGGYLMYSTCTFEQGENINRINQLIEQYDMECLEVDARDIPEGVETIKQNAAVGYAFYPHKIKGEGFFIACLRKREVNVNERKIAVVKAEKVNQDVLAWIQSSAANEVIGFQDEYHLVSKKYSSLKDVFRKHLRIKQEGAIVCTQKGKDLIPAPEFAFSQFVAEEVKRIELNEEQAIRFLKCENIHFSNQPRGWYLATFRNIGLGWMKVMDNRTNNYFPNNWRILK